MKYTVFLWHDFCRYAEEKKRFKILSEGIKMWPVKMTGEVKKWPVKRHFWPVIVRWPAVILSPELCHATQLLHKVKIGSYKRSILYVNCLLLKLYRKLRKMFLELNYQAASHFIHIRVCLQNIVHLMNKNLAKGRPTSHFVSPARVGGIVNLYRKRWALFPFWAPIFWKRSGAGCIKLLTRI